MTFNVGTDPDLAAINVNNRVQAAVPRLPEEVRRQGVVVRKASTTFLQIVGITSPDGSMDALALSSYTALNILDEMRRIPGVGDVQMWGQEYSIRIWMQPDKLAQLGLTPSDVAAAVRQQNSQFAAGRIGVEPMTEQVDFTYAVTAQGRLEHARRVRADRRAHDRRRVDRAPEGCRARRARRADLQLQRDGRRQAGDRHRRLAAARRQRAGNRQRGRGAPRGAGGRLSLRAWPTTFRTTPIQYVKVSIKEVIKTLIEAMILVFFVVLLFLQNWRATIIPMLAVPVSLIGTFAAMFLFGFSINMLTLFGMVLAIGIVVDDAIVVLENVERIMTTEKLPAPEATHEGDGGSDAARSSPSCWC